MNQHHLQNSHTWNSNGTATLAPPQQLRGLHSQAISEHAVRMHDLRRAHADIADTVEALCKLTGFQIDSHVVTSFGMSHIGGAPVIWRVGSPRWQLETCWLQYSDLPKLEDFQREFTRLSTAIEIRRDQLLAEGKPLPRDPPTEEELNRHRAQLVAQLVKMSQQQQAQGMGSVIDQKAIHAMQNVQGYFAGAGQAQGKI